MWRAQFKGLTVSGSCFMSLLFFCLLVSLPPYHPFILDLGRLLFLSMPALSWPIFFFAGCPIGMSAGCWNCLLLCLCVVLPCRCAAVASTVLSGPRTGHARGVSEKKREEQACNPENRPPPVFHSSSYNPLALGLSLTNFPVPCALATKAATWRSQGTEKPQRTRKTVGKKGGAQDLGAETNAQNTTVRAGRSLFGREFVLLSLVPRDSGPSFFHFAVSWFRHLCLFRLAQRCFCLGDKMTR